jgi:hypothetical protein
LLSVEQRILILKELSAETFSHAAASAADAYALKSFSNNPKFLSFSRFAKEARKVFNSFQAVSSNSNNNSLVKMFIEHSWVSFFERIAKEGGGWRRRRRSLKSFKEICEWVGIFLFEKFFFFFLFRSVMPFDCMTSLSFYSVSKRSSENLRGQLFCLLRNEISSDFYTFW